MADEQCNHQTKRACVNGTNILPWVERWLSPERLAPYLEASECDAEKALELYRWNVALGQFLIRDISYFEVALRNAYNDTMEARWDGECHWHGATPPFESFARIHRKAPSATGCRFHNHSWGRSDSFCF